MDSQSYNEFGGNDDEPVSEQHFNLMIYPIFPSNYRLLDQDSQNIMYVHVWRNMQPRISTVKMALAQKSSFEISSETQRVVDDYINM